MDVRSGRELVRDRLRGARTAAGIGAWLASLMVLGCDPSRNAAAGARDAGADASPEPSLPDAGVDASPTLPVDAGVDEGPALRVLFIGNSFTRVNNLPRMLERIAATAGQPPTISVDRVVRGGARLETHWLDGIAQKRINERTWTHVVLQEQSRTPPSETFFEYAGRFGDLAVDAGARPTMFVTWALGREFAQEPVAYQDALTWAYAGVAQRWPSSVLACVGEAFRISLRQHPAIALHQSDDSHPSLAGTYLAASTFYVALTGQPVPDASAVPEGLDADDAALLREVARIGSDCADVQARADVVIPAAPELDFGRAAATIALPVLLSNRGYVAAGIADAQTLAPPFAWTSGTYPGISEVVDGVPPCAESLPRNSYCYMSVSYSGATTGDGRLTLALTGAYTSEVALSLRGTATTEAVLELRHAGVDPALRPHVGETMPLHVIVRNRGGAPTSAIAGAELAPPFHWGPTSAGEEFPGGSGTTTIDGVTYDYCTPVLDVGRECVATAGFSPAQVGWFFTTLGVTYATAEGEFEASIPRAATAIE